MYRLSPLLGSTSEDELRMEEVNGNNVTEEIVRAHRNVRITECGRLNEVSRNRDKQE